MFNIIRRNRRRDKESIEAEMRQHGYASYRGELEIIGSKKGKIFHYDKGENAVLQWAKHATMHTLTGESFSSHGRQRLFDSEVAEGHLAAQVNPSGGFYSPGASPEGEGKNYDGTLLSGEQYFSDNSSPDFSLASRWSRSTISPSTLDGDTSATADDVKFPYFPTKMLFGTGFEFQNWTSIPTDYKTVYEGLGWDLPTFNANIQTLTEEDDDVASETAGIFNSYDQSESYYSNIWTGVALARARSMNDVFSGILTSPVIAETDFGITGAIKDGFYSDAEKYRHLNNSGNGPTEIAKTETIGGQEFLLKEWQGIGHPCFIYPNRTNRFFESGSEIQLSNDTNSSIENKITFQVTMPEQTGTNAGIFYPYNGYTLKVAGLFSDARFMIGNTIDVEDFTGELNDYAKMPYGILFAKRYIAPIQKDASVSITARWTLYV